jgi:hypothetical protein
MAAAGLLFLLLVGAMTRRRRARPLRDIVIERPEVHQAVAYQIGCLRHEFLKHRIGAAGEALHALIRGQASPEQRRFLEERLCKGEPLLAAWRTHVGALERSLGLKFALTRGDPLFRGAQRALAVLGRVATMTRPADARRVEQARDSLERLDRELAELVARLAYCPVDEGFLRDVLVSTRSEWASGKVELDDISVSALAESPHPRRLAVDVLVDLEPTGEEVVRIRVRDSSTQPIEAEASTAAPTGVEHGLGIVRAALHRYDGSLEIAPGGDGYAKAVVVRLFRSQATHPEPLGEAA